MNFLPKVPKSNIGIKTLCAALWLMPTGFCGLLLFGTFQLWNHGIIPEISDDVFFPIAIASVLSFTIAVGWFRTLLLPEVQSLDAKERRGARCEQVLLFAVLQPFIGCLIFFLSRPLLFQ